MEVLYVVAAILVTYFCVHGTFAYDGCLSDTDEAISNIANTVVLVSSVLFPIGWVILVIYWSVRAYLFIKGGFNAR